MEEVLDHVKSGFREAVHTSPLAKEPAYGLKINLEDIVLHEDPVHRGPAQAIPMTWRPIYCCILLSDPKLLEPLMSFECKVPSEFVSSVITLLNKRRGKILDMPSEEDMITVKAEMPVSESFGIADELRGSTSGRALWQHNSAVGHQYQSNCRQIPSKRSANAEDYHRSPQNQKNTSSRNKPLLLSPLSIVLMFKLSI